jgi:adenosine/AMP kinase
MIDENFLINQLLSSLHEEYEKGNNFLIISRDKYPSNIIEAMKLQENIEVLETSDGWVAPG